MTAAQSTTAMSRGMALIAQLQGAGVSAALVGGVGVAVHRHGDSPTALDRTYGDVDVVVAPSSSRAVSEALVPTHVANRRFNALHGDRRLLFNRIDDGEQLDVFVGRFSMCHSLDLGKRLATGTASLSPTDLLLTKAQIVETNDKDFVDLVTLLYHHPVEAAGDPSADVIDLTRLSDVCAGDWGWYTTVTDNLAAIPDRAGHLLDEDGATTVGERCAAIAAHLQQSPKSLRWRTRAKLGRRTPWYELPEEIAHG